MHEHFLSLNLRLKYSHSQHSVKPFAAKLGSGGVDGDDYLVPLGRKNSR